ncbi:hypothetical protein [Streptomyces sp. CBMA123]|uniref:hypothetical protein n=1 Tax=Streptomyces sp. CBMA123 TaxID=1896313 RepID=UPI0016618AF4|nr:hypothetical protein [Streptomyces sp. CBMA123]
MTTAVLMDAPRWRAFAESDSALAGFSAAQRHSTMRAAAARVREFTDLHGFDHESIGIPYSSASGYGEACVLQHVRDRHVSIGLTWLHRDAEHLATVLEHELAHLRRGHGPRRRLRRAVGAAVLVAGSWFLPMLAATVVGVALVACGIAWSWAEELGCDLEARRQCGAASQAALWRAQIVRDRATPRLWRWWDAVSGARSHPPARLRLLLAGGAVLRPSPVCAEDSPAARVTPCHAPQDSTLSP